MANGDIILDFGNVEVDQEPIGKSKFAIDLLQVLIGSGSGGGGGNLNYKGQWAAGTPYSVNDLVLHRGYTWRVITAHTSSGTRIDTSKAEKITGQGPPLPGVSSLKISGHSYMDAVGVGAPARDATAARIADAFGVDEPKVQNIAKSGGDIRHHSGSASYATILQNVNVGPQGFPRAADAGVVYMHWGTNDAIQGGTSSTWVEYTFKEAYKTAISRYISGAVYEQDDPTVSYTGTWVPTLYSSEDAPSGSGLGYTKTNTASSTAIITTPNTMGLHAPGVWVALGFIGEDSGASGEIWLDGVKHGDINVGRGASFGTNFGTGWVNWRTGYVYRLWVPTVADGSDNTKTQPHVIEIKFGASSNSGYLKFDYWQMEATTTPLVLVSSMVQPSNPTGIWAALASPSLHDTYNNWIQSVVTSFANPAIRYVDSDTPMGGKTATWTINSNGRLFNTDGLHPNAEGAKILAEAAQEEAVAALTEGVTTRSLLGRWDNEGSVLTAPPQWYTGAGAPLSTNDDFNRTATEAGPGGTWTVQVGAWGIDGSGQLYIVKNKFSNPTFTDSFARPNSTSVVGNGWTSTQGTWGITNQKLYLTANGASNKSLITRDIGGVNHWAEFNPITSTSSINDLGIVLRCQDANNFVVITFNTTFGGCNVWKVVGGTVTHLTSSAPLVGAPNLGLHAEVGADNIVRVYHILKNSSSPPYLYGQRQVATTTLTDGVLLASNASATRVGVGTPNSAVTTASTVDDFQAANTVSPNIATYSAKWNILTKNFATPDTAIATQIGDSGTGLFANFAGLIFRYQDPDNFYALYASVTFGGWKFDKMVAGTMTNLKTIAGPNTPGTIIGVKMSGTGFTFYANGTQIDTATDSTYTTGNLHGIGFQVSDEKPQPQRWNDFRQGAVVLPFAVGDIYIDNTSSLEEVNLYGPASKTGAFPAAIRMRPTTIDGGSAATRKTLIISRNGTAAAWTSANPVLAAGEVGVETDTSKQKVGNGSTAWTSLAYT
jgi:hypothetical protein